MRFLRNSAASVRLVKSVASRIVRIPATNSMYQFLVLRSLPLASRYVRWKTLADPLRLRPMFRPPDPEVGLTYLPVTCQYAFLGRSETTSPRLRDVRFVA